MKKTELKRVFLYEGYALEDVAPELSPTRSAMVYQDLFPELCRCIAIPHKVDGDNWNFNIIKIA